MVDTYACALAPGTRVNRFKQAQSFIRFCVLYDVDYLAPSIVHSCMYVQYLANTLKSVSSLKNYLSGARSWIIEHDGSIVAFLSPQVEYMIKSVTKTSTHVVKRAFPLSVAHITIIASYLDSAVTAPLCIKAAILLGFSCYLRASNLLSSSFMFLDSGHPLLAKHVVLIPQGLRVTIVSTKTRSNPYVVTVNYNPNTLICPVTAWIRYATSQFLHPNGPAFMLTHSTPLKYDVIVKFMREALKSCPEVDVNNITMHSLRRGAVQSAESAGLPLTDIMKRGGWKSRSGLKPYLTS